MAIMPRITSARKAPFFANSDGTILKYRFVKINPVTNTATYVEDEANAVVIGEALPEYNNAITFLPTGDSSEEVFVELAGTVDMGDYLNSDADGLAVSVATKAEACAQALSGGVAGQIITVRMFLF